MRRCPCSMITIATMIEEPDRQRMSERARALLLAGSPLPSLGSVETIDAKIRIDIPFPMPRCVMSSPSHMMRAVPAVSDRTIRRDTRGREVRDEVGRRCLGSALTELTAVEQERQTGRLQERQQRR